MKIIISHDVDHLDASDHLFRDLILEKLWVRSFLHLCQGRISLKTFFSKYVDFLNGTASVSPNKKTDLAKCKKDKSLNFKDLFF